MASEVKALAESTALAAKDVADKVSSMHAATAFAVTAVEGIGASINEVAAASAAIAAAVEQQTAATAEISRNVCEASAGTSLVTENAGQTSSAAVRSGQTARTVLESAQGLERQAANLQSVVGSFLSGICAA